MKDHASASLLVVGPGSIGLLMASKLCDTGQQVGILDYRPTRAKRLQEISIIENGKRKTEPIQCSADPIMAANYAYILICVKANATRSVAQALSPFLQNNTRILSLQNGLGNQETLNQLLCPHPVRVGISSYGAFLHDEHTVQAAGEGIIQIGSMGHTDSVAMEWHEILQKAGFHVVCREDIQVMLWTKLIMNAALNPVTALYGIRNGEVPEHEKAWETACNLLVESVSIAHRLGIPLDANQMKNQLHLICRSTAENYSSMLMDIQKGRQTEIAAINGTICDAATAHGLSAPCNRDIMQKIQRKSNA